MTHHTDRGIGKVVARSAAGVVAMFAFAVFVMPPLYDMFCEALGIGPYSAGKYEAIVSAVDETRTVNVQFIATNQATMPWDFEPAVFQVRVNPGRPTKVTYYAKNRTPRNMVAQAIPNIVPASASEYFHKTECFCFDRQTLAAGEEVEMPLVFIVDRDLPESINTITLSYSLFDVTSMHSGEVALSNQESVVTLRSEGQQSDAI